MNSIYIGFMRMITFNWNMFWKPTEMGWKKKEVQEE